IAHQWTRSYSTDQSEENQEKWKEALPEIVNDSSSIERRTFDAETEVDAIKKAEYMVDKVGDTYDVIISSVTKIGIFVELPNTI
ncbi:ribonuclease R, partial [Enterococcus faecalis]|nr:ribonuclease R [Enterococcus faecalis]